MSNSYGAASKSIAAPEADKPAKPYADFPLFWHRTGGWTRKTRGRFVYFGRKHWKEALADYLDQKDDLHAGRTPRVRSEELTVEDLCDFFLDHKEAERDDGNITHRSYADYRQACDLIVEKFGKGRLVMDLHQLDFTALRRKLGRGRGVVTIRNLVTRIKVVFNYAVEEGLIDTPVKYGATFKVPKLKQLREARTQRARKSFNASEIKLILDTCPHAQLRAMVYLGVNCGFNNSDCGNLPKSALDLKHGWIDFPRVKTGVQRRCPLWPETIATFERGIAAATGRANCCSQRQSVCHQVRRLLGETHIGQSDQQGTGQGTPRPQPAPTRSQFRCPAPSVPDRR